MDYCWSNIHYQKTQKDFIALRKAMLAKLTGIIPVRSIDYMCVYNEKTYIWRTHRAFTEAIL